jgi:nucleotide-binding universal stress UspA family protein
MLFKRIYTPIDNSDISNKVLLEAINIAKSSQANLRIVHVVNLEQITFGIEVIGVTELRKTLLDIGDKLMQHAQEIANQHGVKVETKLLENYYNTDLVSLIVADAHDWQADLFVLGSHHLGSFSHLITGGVIEDIAEESDIPLLVITKHRISHAD